MGQFIASLSRGTLAFLIITFGTLFIILSNPPPTVCDSQYDDFESKIKNILLIDKKMKVKPTKTRFAIAFEKCRNTNNAGGCYDFFSNLKDVLRELDNTPTQCFMDFGKRPLIRDTLWPSLELITRMAWGERMPASYQESSGWFDSSNMAVVCDLRKKIVNFYGSGGKANPLGPFARKTVPLLPGGSTVSFDRAWPLTIVAKSCAGFR